MLLNPGNSFRIRVSLFDKVEQSVPNIVLYDWQYPPEAGPADLNTYFFADKTAFLILDRGPASTGNERIVLQDVVGGFGGGGELEIRPEAQTTRVDLNLVPIVTGGTWADKVAGIRFEL